MNLGTHYYITTFRIVLYSRNRYKPTTSLQRKMGKIVRKKYKLAQNVFCLQIKEI